MKIVATSDFHGHLPIIPPCDLLLIAGDVCPCWNHGRAFQARWLHSTFANWLKRQPARRIIGVWGNHDLIAEQRPELVEGLPWTVLTDEQTEFEGLVIHGLPWQPRFCDWAFNLDEPELSRKYDMILRANVIVSHGPPAGYGDLCSHGERVGSIAFTKAIERTKCKLAVFGHIHEDAGQWDLNGSILANVTHVNERYQPTNTPAAFEIL